MTYAEKLKDPRWQKKRLEIMQLANFACELCEETELTLHIHHRYYIKGRHPWQYPNFALQCLCSGCHNGEHIIDADEPSFSTQSWEVIAEVFIGGINAQEREMVDGGSWDLAVEFGTLAKRIGKHAAVGLCLNAISDYRRDTLGEVEKPKRRRHCK